MKRYYFKRDIINNNIEYSFFSTEMRDMYFIQGDRIANPNGIDIGSIHNSPVLKKELNSFKIKERINKLSKI